MKYILPSVFLKKTTLLRLFLSTGDLWKKARDQIKS